METHTNGCIMLLGCIICGIGVTTKNVSVKSNLRHLVKSVRALSAGRLLFDTYWILRADHFSFFSPSFVSPDGFPSVSFFSPSIFIGHLFLPHATQQISHWFNLILCISGHISTNIKLYLHKAQNQVALD